MRILTVIRNNRQRLRKRNVRQLITIGVLLTVFIFSFYTLYASRISRLNDARYHLQRYEQELAEVMLRQGFYENEIIRLENDDYIAMLARGLYFRSLPHEIVFRIADSVVELPDDVEEN